MNFIIENNEEKLDKILFLINKGAPKHKPFINLLINNPSLKKRLEKVNMYYSSKEMAKERLKLEEELFYIYEEKNREVVLTPKGEEDLSSKYPGQFELEDITAVISDIQGDESLSEEDKAKKESSIYEKYEEKSKRIKSFSLSL